MAAAPLVKAEHLIPQYQQQNKNRREDKLLSAIDEFHKMTPSITESYEALRPNKSMLLLKIVGSPAIIPVTSDKSCRKQRRQSNYNKVIKSDSVDNGWKATLKEIHTLEKMKVWGAIDQTKGKNIIRSTWDFKLK